VFEKGQGRKEQIQKTNQPNKAKTKTNKQINKHPVFFLICLFVVFIFFSFSFASCFLLAIVSCFLFLVSCFLVFGFWFLVFGFWFLVFGFSLLFRTKLDNTKQKLLSPAFPPLAAQESPRSSPTKNSSTA